jgi:hypothetical protein
LLNTLEVVTTVVVGVMVGVEFSVAFVMNPILNALPEDSGQLGHAHGGRMLGAVMPVWYIGSLVLVAVWAIAGWHHPGASLVVTAGTLLLAPAARPDQQPEQDVDPRKPARRLERAEAPLGTLPLCPCRRHHRRLHPAHRRLHPARRRPRLTPQASPALGVHT